MQSLAPSSKFEPVLPLTVMDKEFLPLDHFLQKPKEETRPNQPKTQTKVAPLSKPALQKKTKQ